jgi:serine/threonine-protein kinase SRPK3
MALCANRCCRPIFQIPSFLSIPRPTSLPRTSATAWRRALSTAPPGPLPPRVFPSTGFTLLDPTQRIEEEGLHYYSPRNIYPAQIGEVLDGRYQIVGKLGFEFGATTWLCRDIVYVELLCSASGTGSWMAVNMSI